jgi:hypothetical protein
MGWHPATQHDCPKTVVVQSRLQAGCAEACSSCFAHQLAQQLLCTALDTWVVTAVYE